MMLPPWRRYPAFVCLLMMGIYPSTVVVVVGSHHNAGAFQSPPTVGGFSREVDGSIADSSCARLPRRRPTGRVHPQSIGWDRRGAETKLAAVAQPRRYHPRWGQEGVFPTRPLSYREPQQKSRPGSTAAGEPGSATKSAADNGVSQAGVEASGKGGGGGNGGTGGDEENSSVAERRAGRMRFRGLLADRFQHPFDLEATRALRRLPGLELAIRSAVPAIEDAVFMDNIANSILVGPRQMGSLHGLLVEACRILDMQVPDLYIRQNPVPNAYTLAIRGKKPFIVLHTSLVDLMEPEEVQAVIAHELGHLKCEHGIWVTLATVLANGLYRGGFLGAFVAERLGLRGRLMRWSRAAEFTCDRAAILVSQDVNVVVSTFLKLAGGSISQASELSVPEFLKQASAYDLASKTRIGKLLRTSQSMELTHPLPVIRARELVKFSESSQYLGLLRRGLPL